MKRKITIIDKATNESYTLLATVPTSIWWKVKVLLTSILWVLSTSETKKSWKEFYYGLINHDCEFDYDNLKSDKYGKHYECKHFGCNIVSVRDKNGNWL